MSTYDLPQESELIISSHKAAYCARRRLRQRNGRCRLTLDSRTQPHRSICLCPGRGCWSDWPQPPALEPTARKRP